jgi:hypothetical protein
MRFLGLLVALFIALIGLIGLCAPEFLLAIGQYTATPVGIYVAAALRIGLGLVLVCVAPDSRAPRILRILGVIAIIGGMTIPFIGTERVQAILAWWSTQGSVCVRLGAGLALVLGGFIAYAVVPGRRGA